MKALIRNQLALGIENGKITAEYSKITDTSVRSLVFRVKVNEEAKVGEPIVNKATIDDHINPPDGTRNTSDTSGDTGRARKYEIGQSSITKKSVRKSSIVSTSAIKSLMAY